MGVDTKSPVAIRRFLMAKTQATAGIVLVILIILLATGTWSIHNPANIVSIVAAAISATINYTIFVILLRGMFQLLPLCFVLVLINAACVVVSTTLSVLFMTGAIGNDEEAEDNKTKAIVSHVFFYLLIFIAQCMMAMLILRYRRLLKMEGVIVQAEEKPSQT